MRVRHRPLYYREIDDVKLEGLALTSSEQINDAVHPVKLGLAHPVPESPSM